MHSACRKCVCLLQHGALSLNHDHKKASGFSELTKANPIANFILGVFNVAMYTSGVVGTTEV